MEDVKVDAVVINGGMSKLYLIQERLEKFFGFKPILALDPDQAVARGAAVYHYYLHKSGENDVALRVALQETNDAGIQLRKTVLNDALYLGTSGGAHELLVDAGTNLPFKSEIITGFSILPKQSKIKIPIRKKEAWGDFVTIAIGEIIFECSYKTGAEVSIRFSLSKNKILSFEAKTEKEVGTTTILIDRGGKIGSSSPLVMPKQGSRLLPNNEISRLKNLCNERRKAKSKSDYRSLLKKQMNNILHCGNPEDFSFLILKHLKEYHCNKNRDDFFAQRLLVIARKLFQYWPDEQKRLIAD
jgi:molecular chaperone DnaK (HSP70)